MRHAVIPMCIHIKQAEDILCRADTQVVAFMSTPPVSLIDVEHVQSGTFSSADAGGPYESLGLAPATQNYELATEEVLH